MKTLARKVEEFIDAALGDTSVPKYFTTFGENVKERPFIGVQATTGWNTRFQYENGERTAVLTVSVESNADDDTAAEHDAIAAEVEAALGDKKTITEAAATIPAFTLTIWTPGDSGTITEDRVRTTTFNYTARVRDDNQNNP
jgi:hypothetical protein